MGNNSKKAIIFAIRIDDGFVGDQIAVGRIFEDPRHPARHFDAPDAAGDVPVDEPRHRLLSADRR